MTSWPELIRGHARAQPTRPAVEIDAGVVTYGELDAWADRIASSLQRDGLEPRQVAAFCAAPSVGYLAALIGALRAGMTVAPLPPSAHPRAIAGMLADSGARVLFGDAAAAHALRESGEIGALRMVALDPLGGWLLPPGCDPSKVAIDEEWPFNIIYSSGTTGTPKGIVQSHAFRAANIRRAASFGYGPASVTLLATPLYSNMTLATLIGALGQGGTVLLMPKFSVEGYLRLARERRATHTILVPVQYQRLLDHDAFDVSDLSSLRMKFSTGAPFPASLKARVLERWPGGLLDIYGMTEGGATCVLPAHEHPDKLHTVGRPWPGHELRFVDESGRELPAGEAGEIVGHSPGMMSGYLNRPDATRDAEWRDPTGKRFIRTGDIGRMDADGFVTLLARKKDLIISGGFNIYPVDLEAALLGHPDVAEAAVFGVGSERWGETPVACVVLHARAFAQEADLAEWANRRLGKFQRLAAVRIVQSLPRSEAGKVLKRELRNAWVS